MVMIYTSMTDLIGKTPMLKLTKLDENSADVYVKLEYFNPGGSVKDRIALAMIEAAEQAGNLKPGMTIIEATSGNTGIGMALVSAVKGYPVILVMPETMSIERRKIVAAYGATLVLTEGAKGMKGAIAKAEELLSANADYYMLRQFENEANPIVHEKTTGQEIIADFHNQTIDAFVAGVGTGGTLTGVSRALKKVYPEIEIIAVEPSDSPVLSGGLPGPHKIQGIGAGFIPAILETDLIQEVMQISNQVAFDRTKQLASTYGVLLGSSAGAAIEAAIQVAKRLGKGKVVVVVAPDNGERYLSTTQFD
ncbi:MAG: cysteine synthase A [Culicoidibacterales bacterium]